MMPAESIPPPPAPAEHSTWPATLWPLVETLLIAHFDLRDGGGGWLGEAESPSEAVENRAARGSVDAKRKCSRCRGTGKIGTVYCDYCDGTGKPMVRPKPKELYVATTICALCRGSGRHRRKGVFLSFQGFIPNSNYDCSVEDMGTCVTCRGGGYLDGVDAAPSGQITQGGPTSREVSTVASIALAKLSPVHVTTLSAIYGPQGRDYRGTRRLLPLWPFTAAGSRLLLLAPIGGSPSSRIRELLSSGGPNLKRDSLVAQAEQEATVALAQARIALYTADSLSGGNLLAAARKEARQA